GEPTNPKSIAEGLLLNVRMVNATFEDRNPETCPKGFDPEKNTAAFIAKIPEYVACGVNAFTLCLQGGFPGYEGAINSAYEPDGSLRPGYMQRVARVIEACDRAGAVVILGCFYQRQDQILKDADAVRRAVAGTAEWIRSRGYTSILLEIANEFPHAGFDHKLIQDELEIRQLMQLARKTAPGLLVSASSLGNGRTALPVATESDFVLLHFNGIDVDTIFLRVATMSKFSKALVCNEDDKTGEKGAQALEGAVYSMCSYGYMNKQKNQYYPFEFDGAADDPPVYAKFKELSSPQ
ncbi:MAG: hypothetical protein JXA90_03085, partial [Planctomycetes bacterium]|nr:hypothetical protein [Planctomycetota bacterium]